MHHYITAALVCSLTGCTAIDSGALDAAREVQTAARNRATWILCEAISVAEYTRWCSDNPTACDGRDSMCSALHTQYRDVPRDSRPVEEAARIFVAYRHDDTSGSDADAIVTALTDALGPDAVFFDRRSIAPGARFPTAIESALETATAMVAIIGRDWLDPRLQVPGDYLRTEIATALRREIPVVPVLVDGASLPPREALPPDMWALLDHQALELRTRADLQRLVTALRSAPPPRPTVPRAPAPEPVPAPTPLPRPEQFASGMTVEAICAYQPTHSDIDSAGAFWAVVEQECLSR